MDGRRPSPSASSLLIAGLRRSGHDAGSLGSQLWNPPIGRRKTKNDVGPAAATSRANDSFTPRTTDDNATTTNTPTATPMMVSAARPLFERMDSKAMLTPSSARVTLAKKLMSRDEGLRWGRGVMRDVPDTR